METAKSVIQITQATASESQNAVDKYGYVIFQIIGITGALLTIINMALSGFSIIYALILCISLVFFLSGYIWNKTEKKEETTSFS